MRMLCIATCVLNRFGMLCPLSPSFASNANALQTTRVLMEALQHPPKVVRCMGSTSSPLRALSAIGEHGRQQTVRTPFDVASGLLIVENHEFDCSQVPPLARVDTRTLIMAFCVFDSGSAQLEYSKAQSQSAFATHSSRRAQAKQRRKSREC